MCQRHPVDHLGWEARYDRQALTGSAGIETRPTSLLTAARRPTIDAAGMTLSTQWCPAPQLRHDRCRLRRGLMACSPRSRPSWTTAVIYSVERGPRWPHHDLRRHGRPDLKHLMASTPQAQSQSRPAGLCSQLRWPPPIPPRPPTLPRPPDSDGPATWGPEAVTVAVPWDTGEQITITGGM